jgi:flagellin FlaB
MGLQGDFRTKYLYNDILPNKSVAQKAMDSFYCVPQNLGEIMQIRYHEDAFTGLEAAIVLIAFVVVAAVFSYVVLGAGFFTTQKTQETVYQAVGQSTTNIIIKGSIYGFAPVAGSAVSYVNMTLGVAPGAPSVDMTKMKIVYSNATIGPITLSYTGLAASVPPAAGYFYASQPSVTGDEQVLISIPTIPPTGGWPGAPANTEINIELRPPGGGAPIPITKTIPASTLLVNVLR